VVTKRLQVLLEDDELAEIQALAKRRRQTTAAFVRDALRAAKQSSDYPTVESKLRALREAVSHAYPTADIDQMNEEIERGYSGGLPAADA
jgi:hypothetical protein